MCLFASQIEVLRKHLSMSLALRKESSRHIGVTQPHTALDVITLGNSVAGEDEGQGLGQEEQLGKGEEPAKQSGENTSKEEGSWVLEVPCETESALT